MAKSMFSVLYMLSIDFQPILIIIFLNVPYEILLWSVPNDFVWLLPTSKIWNFYVKSEFDMDFFIWFLIKFHSAFFKLKGSRERKRTNDQNDNFFYSPTTIMTIIGRGHLVLFLSIHQYIGLIICSHVHM